MKNSDTISRAAAIIQDNLDYTLFSWSKQKGISPLAVKRAQGVYLYDHDDKRYIDFSSGLMNVNIGHGNQRVTRAVVQQMEQVSYVTPGCVTEVRGELGKKLASVSPKGLNKTFFTVCGATAIENAIKLARLYTGRHKIIARYRAFHGASYGAMTAGGDPRKLQSDSQQMPNVIHVEDPYCYRCPFGKEVDSCSRECVSHIERVIQFEGPENVAAVLMEGQADIAQETQQLKVVVIPEINAGSASLIASAINPLVGLTTFLAQVILRRPLIEANTQEFQIDGTWLDPHVTKVEHK